MTWHLSVVCHHKIPICSPILIMSPLAQGEVDHDQSVRPAEVEDNGCVSIIPRINQSLNIARNNWTWERPLKPLKSS